MKTFKKVSLMLLLFYSATAFAQEKQDVKIQKSATVLKEFAAMEEDIPAQLMQKAQGIVVIPGLINAGLGIGGQRGKGVALVKNADGSWSDPVFVTLTGGSFGFQAGVQSTDLVLIFVKGKILNTLAKGEFTLGGNIGVAAGPLGRSSSANTDTKFDAEVYSYSRSKGLFAGLTVNGSKLETDAEANTLFYKNEISAESIFSKSITLDNADVTSLKAAIKALY